jgi:fumarate reductase subunit D
MLFHWAHRFKYTVVHGLQLARVEGALSVLCYGAALLGSVAVLVVVATV